MPLSVRQSTCADCGAEYDRDTNAARNIECKSLATARGAGNYACGEKGAGRSRKTPVKHSGETASVRQAINQVCVAMVDAMVNRIPAKRLWLSVLPWLILALGLGLTALLWPFETWWCSEKTGLILLAGGGSNLILALVIGVLTTSQKRIASALAEANRNIVERRRAEDALRESEARFRSYFELPLVGIAVTTPDRGWIDINPRFCEILDYSPEALRQKTWADLTYPDDLDADVEQFNRVLAGEINGYSLEKRFVRRNGEVISTEINVTCVRDAAGQPRYFIALVQDITVRKQAESALNQTRLALEEAQRLARMGSWEWEIATDTITWSREFCRIFGWAPDQPPPAYREHLQLYTAESMARLQAAVERTITVGTPYQLDLEAVRPDGSRRWITSHGEPRYDAHHRIFGLHGVGLDITDRRRMEAALRESETKFRLAFDNANTGMCLVDLQGRFLQVNARMCVMVGYSQAELEGMTVNDLTVPEDKTISLEFIDGATQGDAHSATFEKRYQHRQGHVLYVQIASSLVHDGQGQPLYFISQVQDITDRKRLEAELREQAIRDPLTGLFNRRYLDETLQREFHRCQRNGKPLSAAMLDLDHFKRFNDVYGHEAGDSVLQATGELLRRSLRADDIACRYGGEELAVILPGSTPENAQARLDGLRQKVMEMRLSCRESPLPAITVSIGVATVESDETDATTLLNRADAALYQAKAQGRNRVVCYADALQ